MEEKRRQKQTQIGWINSFLIPAAPLILNIKKTKWKEMSEYYQTFRVSRIEGGRHQVEYENMIEEALQIVNRKYDF